MNILYIGDFHNITCYMHIFLNIFFLGKFKIPANLYQLF